MLHLWPLLTWEFFHKEYEILSSSSSKHFYLKDEKYFGIIKNLLWFLVFEPLFIRDGYYIKFFFLMTTNTSSHVVLRGVVRSSKNVRLSQIFLLMFFLYYGRRLMVLWRFFYIWKQVCPYLVAFSSSTWIWFFITCFTLRRVMLGSVYRRSHDK